MRNGPGSVPGQCLASREADLRQCLMPMGFDRVPPDLRETDHYFSSGFGFFLKDDKMLPKTLGL
ncbi:hypothetical protein SAMN06295998_10211 [Primorskyibacter flagellatus]|uniref:Uncharacterized protein n=1 Tax=Primorskyibacter flagellatus TaxID=1387277 RepID=A0A1W1ZN19_9RHOB|nr:hypothetical protein SAMN06295998_10211 [Primorskyibacter flagellatus]